MLELSDEIVNLLLNESVFTAVMDDRLSPLVSSVEEVYPFANYVIREENGQSLDGDVYNVALLFYFEQNSYRKCVAFLDQMKPIIKEKYDWLNSEVEFVEVDQSFVGIINFNKI
jgi:predicted RNA-binding protein